LSLVCRRGLSSLTQPSIFLQKLGQAQVPAQGDCWVGTRSPTGAVGQGLSTGTPPSNSWEREKTPKLNQHPPSSAPPNPAESWRFQNLLVLQKEEGGWETRKKAFYKIHSWLEMKFECSSTLS